MRLLPLLNILPADIVKIIYKIMVYYQSVNIIQSRFFDNKFKHLLISEIILAVLFNSKIYYNKVRYLLFPQTVRDLQFIANNPIHKLYNRNFWIHLLSEMAYILMNEHNNLCSRNQNYNTNPRYKNLKLVIGSWFILCQRFNLKIRVYYRNINFRKVESCKNIWTRSIKKINCFDKFLHTPVIINRNDETICNDRTQSKLIIQSYFR